MRTQTRLLKSRLLLKRLITWIFFNTASRFFVATLQRHAPSIRLKLQPILASLHSMGEFTIVVPAQAPAGDRPRLLIDVSTTFRMKQLSGIQRTVRELTSALIRNGGSYSHEPVAVRMRREGVWKRVLVFAPGFPDSLEEGIPLTLKPGDCFLMLDSSWDLYPAWADALFPVVRRLGGKVFTCVYDILPITHPQFFTDAVVRMFRQWFASIAQSDVLLAISATTKDELQKQIELERTAKDYFHLGADFRPEPIKSNQPNKGSASFLMVGTIEPRKGHSTVLAAFGQLWEQGLNVRLVFVGRPGWKVSKLMSEIDALDRANPLFEYHAGASDELLAKCYDEAHAVIAASLAEGFGLPLVEAMMLGKPLIASDIAAFREIAGDFPLYFEVGNPAALSVAVCKFLNGGATSRSNEHINWLTWDQSADQLMGKISDQLRIRPAAPGHVGAEEIEGRAR